MPGKKNKKRPSSYERSNKPADNLQKFAEMMSNIITKAKSKNWRQGWLGVKGTILGLPQNITGRTYSGGNSFFLMADTSEKGYNTPVYMTFKQAKDRNLHVNAGEKSVPIFKWGLSIKDEKGKTVSEEDYNAMSKEERDKFSVRPYPKVYHVFNIDQTNLSEVNKKKYDAIVARFKAPDEEVKDSKGMYINDALDRMFKEKAWHCDIRYNKPSSRAFYVPSQDFIVLPMKEQFNIGKTAEEVYRDGMEYYSTALHEMAHSTGHESRLNRQFGAKRTEGYAHEELIAEMTAALVGSTMGFDKKILENNANYLKGWLENLKRNPESITTIMSDVGKASDMIIEKIDEQRVALGQTPLKEGNLEGLTEDLGEETQQSSKISNEEAPQEEISEETVTSSERQDDDISNILDNKPLIEKVPYGEFYLPEWSIPYLKDGNEYGLTAEQLKTVKDFEKDFPSKLSIEITESSIEGNHNTELGPATTVDKAKIYYFEQHISDLFPTDESTRDRLDKDLSEDNKNRKTLSDLQAQHSNINAQYPAAVNDERTRQLAKRIRQAEQIITAYNANVEAVYGQDFMFSEAANKVMIPQSIYSGQLKPLSVVQDQGANQEKKVSDPESLQIPVWEAYEKEKSQTGDFTYQDTAEEYGNMLLKGVENILPRIKGTLTIDQWGSDVLSAKIENDPRIFDTYIIPEPLKAWLEVSPKEESHSNMQGSSTGKNVDIVAAYVFSTILLQKENQEVDLSFTIDGKQWDNYNEVMQGKSDHSISDEAFAAAWALDTSMGISKHDLSKNAVAVLKNHIDTTEYYGEATLNGSKGGIELLQSGKVSADYSVKGQQVTVEASPKIDEELHTEQEKNNSVPESLQVPVWEAYEKEKGNPGESTYQNTVDDYTKKLIAGVEDILPNVDAVVNVNEKGEKSLAINLWHNPYRTIVASYIPEPLEKWLDLTTVKEPVANSKDKWLLSGHIEGDKHLYNNSQIVAAYMVSDLLSGKERDFLSLPMSYSNGDKQYTEDFRKDSSITREENAAFIAIEESKGINQEYLIPSAITNLERKIKNDRYHLEGSEGAIDLLKSGQISAAYTEVLSKSENLDNASKVEESYTVSEIENAVAYGTISKLEYIQMIPLEGMKERYNQYCSQHTIDNQKEESAIAFLDYVKYNNLSEKWWPETSQTEDMAENVPLSEDSNPETNVASIAKNIMEKGNVPKEVAEKQATVIADAQQTAIEEKKQKAEQAKQAALKKAEDERRREVEEEKRREEENKQQEKDSGPSSKLLLHAALLLGALELAKGNKGIWMNKAGKSNAEFIGAKRPIMAYNNIMMNLQSDRQGYRSNVYTTYDSAKDAGTAVKQNEESLAFNWVKWDYQHVGTKELISREDYDKLPAEEKEFYTKHKSKEEYGIFNIDQTTMPAGKQADYTALLKDKGAKIDQLTERGVSSMMKFAEKLKSNHPTSMVIARTDSKYQIYGKDASRAGKLLNLPVSQTEENGQRVKSVSFPLDRINDYLPKLVEAKQWVVVAENLDSAELIRQLPNEKEVISNANQTAQRVAKSAGIGYERVMVLQDAAYDKQADKIIVSGMSDKDAGDSRQAALQKANDIYRAVVAATGSEHRLDRMGRNNLLPVDDAKYERFVQDLAAGVLMARQGLPATLSKESMQNVNYLQREIRENPKMLGLIEKDVNNAIESIDKHLKQEIVKYEDIRKELTPKDLIVSPKQYKISSDLAKIPDIESKQIVIVRDKAKGAADVILPEGASLDDDVEISGIRKDRIKIALGKEGISDVKFYNAGGGLGLNETNDYYKGKEVSVDKLKQYDFSQHRDIDVKPQIEAAKVANIKLFTPIKDDKGQYAFFFKVDNEPSFAVYPNEAHKRAYFDARNTDQKKEIHEALAQKYYSVAQKHPEIKVDLIMPKVPAVDMSKIERPTITKDRDDPNKKYVMATIDGKLMKEPISKDQWNKMWLADDMAEYKKAVAAVAFAPFLKVEEKNENPIKQEKQENVSSNQEQTLSQSEDTNEEDVQQEETTPRTVKPRGMGIG
ncbi:zincin-like metallopeptidase domain-containing protein [Prevotella melaninogenica]|uniref:zincin-like metallopeptidase domain-containing protein n=1 Tax=Prevotella melaninogenica TaxID=28132 RepID=UPI0021518E2A|nr:ArdC-like ssDNA-binding domain-containing protein [Prevotella melaninogenica]